MASPQSTRSHRLPFAATIMVLALAGAACSSRPSPSNGSADLSATGSGGVAPECTTDDDCAAMLPATEPADCARARCDALQGRCVFEARDQDGDGHAAAQCAAAGVAIVAGDDCNDEDANLYPGHPEDCSAAADGTAITWPTGAPVGICKHGQLTCLADGSESACTGAVAPAPRQCSSGQDNDCDGKVDSSECGCSLVPSPATQSCFTYPAPAQAGKGICKSGTSTCTSTPDGTDTTWGPCVGEVGPAAKDTCNPTSNPDSDANCNGKPDEGCTCTNGMIQSCALPPLNAKGVCASGTTTCINGAWGACSVHPGAVNCTSTADNDCNGTADNLQNPPCTCNALGGTQACGGHGSADGKGPCHAGAQKCISSGQSSAWGPCDSPAPVGPGNETCDPSYDNDCNGTPGDGPGCVQRYYVLVPPNESFCTINPGSEPATTEYMMSTASNEAGWQTWASFTAWTPQAEFYPNMVALRRCLVPASFIFPAYHTMVLNGACPAGAINELTAYVSTVNPPVTGDTSLLQLLQSNIAFPPSVGYTPLNLLGALECIDSGTSTPGCNRCSPPATTTFVIP